MLWFPSSCTHLRVLRWLLFRCPSQARPRTGTAPSPSLLPPPPATSRHEGIVKLRFQGKRIAFCITGAYHKVPAVIDLAAQCRSAGAEVTVIVSPATLDIEQAQQRQGRIAAAVVAACGRAPLTTMSEAERTGPGKLYDLVIVAPCTGNTLAKLANAITDGPVPMTVKAHLRNQRPVLIAISTNDGLGLNARNLGALLPVRNVFFVPFGQDRPQDKPASLDADLDLLLDAAAEALQGRQLQPVLVQRTPDGGKA